VFIAKIYVHNYVCIYRGIDDSETVEISTMESLPTTEALASESNYSVPFIFKCCAILTGIVGVITNGVVLAALLSKDRVKKTVNIFIINQVALDLFSSVFLFVSQAMKLSSIEFVGKFGWFFCTVFDSDMITFVGLTGSIVSLVVIAAERYFLIVHPVIHKTQMRRWTILAIGTLPWIEGVVINMPSFWTSAVVDGVCFKYYFWPNESSQLTYSICAIILTFFIPLSLLVFFYGSVLFVVRRRSQVFQGHYTNQDMSTVLQKNAHRAQMNIISTMIIVSVAFAVCWFPSQTWYLFLIIQYNVPSNDTFYSFSMFLIFLNISLNPFIYATKLNPVKKKLRGWVSRSAPTVVIIA